MSWIARSGRLAACLAVALAVAACAGGSESTTGQEPTNTSATPPPTATVPSDVTSADDTQESTPTPEAAVDRYLPGWVPEGYELKEITSLDGPEEYETAEPVSQESLLLGDSTEVSDTSVMITGQRFATTEDLEHALWLEDALMVQFGGGPSDLFSIEGAVFAYQKFPGGEFEGAQFHAVLNDTLVTGLIMGPLDRDATDLLLSSLLVDVEVNITINADRAGLIELDRGPSEGQVGYDLTYSNGAKQFSVFVNPGSPEARLARGSPVRSSDRLEGDIGAGYFEAQPEVGAATGAHRLIWWVPTVRLQVWFGSTLTEEEAIRVADSFEFVDDEAWQAETAGLPTGGMDWGVINLPENPRERWEALQDEGQGSEELAEQRAALDIDGIADFVGTLRGGDLGDNVTVDWLGPVEADQMTAGASFWPDDVNHVLMALRVTRPTDSPSVDAERRRQDVRGTCCSVNGITLVDGMDEGEAAVVAAHEFTHLYDINVLRGRARATTELFDPWTSLREGNATRVMLAYRDAHDIHFNPDNRPYLQLDMAVAVRRVLTFHYTEGQLFAAAVVEADGEAAIDRAFTTDPPLSTEHILHPESYLDGDVPVPVEPPEPPPGVTVEHRGTLGAFGIALIADRELDWDEAVAVSGAWAGDSYVAWSDGNRQCIEARVEFDDEDSAQEFIDAATTPESVERSGTTVHFESCSL